MANHLRRQIREAAVTAVTGLATTGARVFKNRVYPLQDSELPALVIATNDEAISSETAPRPRSQQRELALVIEAVAKANDDLDDTLDQIAKEVEIALAANGQAWLAGIAKWASLSQIEIELRGESEKVTGSARLTYLVTYMALETAPDVAL